MGSFSDNRKMCVCVCVCLLAQMRGTGTCPHHMRPMANAKTAAPVLSLPHDLDLCCHDMANGLCISPHPKTRQSHDILLQQKKFLHVVQTRHSVWWVLYQWFLTCHGQRISHVSEQERWAWVSNNRGHHTDGIRDWQQLDCNDFRCSSCAGVDWKPEARCQGSLVGGKRSNKTTSK